MCPKLQLEQREILAENVSFVKNQSLEHFYELSFWNIPKTQLLVMINTGFSMKNNYFLKSGTTKIGLS